MGLVLGLSGLKLHEQKEKTHFLLAFPFLGGLH